MNHRLSPVVQEREKRWVTEFALSQLIEKPGTRIPVADIFARYQMWLGTRGESQLSVDGFGRLFPKHFNRGHAYWEGSSCQCVFGVGLI